jgi:hypothetical protein
MPDGNSKSIGMNEKARKGNYMGKYARLASHCKHKQLIQHNRIKTKMIWSSP